MLYIFSVAVFLQHNPGVQLCLIYWVDNIFANAILPEIQKAFNTTIYFI